LFFVPDTWTPDQIRQYQSYFEAMLNGNIENRQRAKFLPGVLSNQKSLGRKDQDFAQFDLWLVRRTCAIFGVQLASLGFAGEQYKVSQEDAFSATTRLGVASLLAIRKELYDEALEDLGFGDLEINDRESAEETPLEQTQRLVVACGGPYLTINEARKAEGVEAVAGGDVVLVQTTVGPLGGGSPKMKSEPLPTSPLSSARAQEEGAACQMETQ
jgi:hypothetical protein